MTQRAWGESVSVADGSHAHRGVREARFWDEHLPSLDVCVRQFEAGPDPNTRLMLDALEPLQGKAVLDFACGTGVTTLWLAARGADVIGLDVSRQSIERADELSRRIGADPTFLVGDLASPDLDGRRFDRVTGRFALHHVDCASVAPQFASLLTSDGRGAFLETIDRNPVLRLARRFLVGRFGIPRYGTSDEHPLTANDLNTIEEAFGSVGFEVAEMRFLRILDRQVLRYRRRRISHLLGRIDDLLLAAGLGRWSYHQVVVCSTAREARPV